MDNKTNRYIYIGLTATDVTNREFYYSLTDKSIRPLAEDIKSLRRIIKDEGLNKIKWYTTIPYHALLDYSLESYNYVRLDKTIMGKISYNRVYSLNNLFHGSPTGGITTLVPTKSELIKVFPIVFAGERWLAVSNVQRWSDDDLSQGVHNDIPYLTEKYKGAFNKIYNKGGYLYSVADKSFTQHGSITQNEYYSKVIVPIIECKYIENPINELLKMGVQLNFYNGKSLFLEDNKVMPNMLHLSKGPKLGVLKPRVPIGLSSENVKMSGYEDTSIGRICFAPTIDGCLLGMQINDREFINSGNLTLYVYKAEYISPKNILTNENLVQRELVFDAHITGESWVTAPVRVTKIGSISVFPYDANSKEIEFTPLRLNLIDRQYLNEKGKLITYLPKWEYID